MLLSKRLRYNEQRASFTTPNNDSSSSSFRKKMDHKGRSTSCEYDGVKNIKEMDCVHDLKEGCRLAKIPLSENQIFRFAFYCNFDYELARTTIVEKFDDPHLHLRMEGDLLHQFESKVLFPLPGLKTKNKKQEVLYFHGSRHFPSKTPTKLLIKNMCYVLNAMSVTEEHCRNGVVFIVNLDQLTLENFSNEFVNKFLTALERQVPTRVEAVLFVNVPAWCLDAWKSLTKTVVSKSFSKKFLFLRDSSQLGWYLMDGYGEYLPKELGYWLDSNEIVEDFIDKKVYEEEDESRNYSSISHFWTHQ